VLERNTVAGGAPLQITEALPAPAAGAASVPTLGLSRPVLEHGPRQAVGFGNARYVRRNRLLVLYFGVVSVDPEAVQCAHRVGCRRDSSRRQGTWPCWSQVQG
jgi:hypothetical protein